MSNNAIHGKVYTWCIMICSKHEAYLLQMCLRINQENVSSESKEIGTEVP